MMRGAVTRFTHAILRAPGASAVRGLRAVDRGAPDLAGLRAEHGAYGAALAELGLAIATLPPLEAHPDAQFVEDPALVFAEGAILLRPGAPSRAGEVGALAPALASRFPQILTLKTGFAEGGDALTTPDDVVIGLSSRTDEAGAEALASLIGRLGRKARVVAPPPGVLHFKTACSLVAEDVVLATPELLAGGDFFSGLKVIETAPREAAAANALCVNGAVLLAAGFPETARRLRAADLQVRELALDNTMLLDAGLSCMSLRWASS